MTRIEEIERRLLATCPHCGGPASFNDTQHMEGLLKPPVEDGTFYVRCLAGCLHLRDTELDAIAAWNKRQPSPLVLLEKIRAELLAKTISVETQRWSEQTADFADAVTASDINEAINEAIADLVSEPKP